MDNDNLLQRCETLEADFNALDDYFEKRDFVKKFLEDIEPHQLTYLHDYYLKEFDKEEIKDYDKALEQFKKSKDAPAIKIRQDACNKAKELFIKEFKKIEKKVIIETAASIFIHECNRQNKDLKVASRLIKDNSQNAISEFDRLIKKSIEKNDISFKYCIYDIIEKYNVDHYNGLDFDNVMLSIECGTLFTDYIFIFGSDLAEVIIEKIDNIIKEKTTTETPTGEIKKVLVNEIKEAQPQTFTNENKELSQKIDKLRGEIGKLKQEIKETPPQRIIIKEVQQNKKAIPTPTTKTPTVENNKPYKPHKYQPCTYFKHTNQKVTYLIGIGELDTIIANNNKEKKEVLKALKKLSFINENGEDTKVFSESDFGGKERYQDEIKLSDNIGIFKNVGDYINYRNEDDIPSNKNYPVTGNSIDAVKSCLQKDIFKNLEMTFNANLKY